MKTFIILLFLFSLGIAQTDLSDIPNKSTGDTYTAAEFNIIKNNIHTWKYILISSTPRTVTADEVKAGYVFMCNTTSDTVKLTLPAESTIPNDGYVHQLSIGHNVGEYPVILYTAVGDSFVYNNTWFNLGSHPFFFNLGGVNTGSLAEWGLQRNLTVKGWFHRDNVWAASNFSSMAIIPWDHEAVNSQGQILVYTSGTSSRVTVKTAGSYKVSYKIDINSTGGSTWNATSYIYKNGSAVEGTEVRTGNYGSEDQSMTLPPIYIDLDKDDYLDLRIDQNNLTGELETAFFLIEIRL